MTYCSYWDEWRLAVDSLPDALWGREWLVDARAEDVAIVGALWTRSEGVDEDWDQPQDEEDF